MKAIGIYQENSVKTYLRKADGGRRSGWLKESFQGRFLFYSTELCLFSGKVRENRIIICNHFIWTVTWILDILDSALNPPRLLAAVTVEMIHNTLKSTQLSERSPRSTHSAAQRRLWRYSGCRRTGLVESQRHSVCVLSADLNGGEAGEGRGGGGPVMHTIHGLCHLCIGCRLPQVCLCYR